MFGTNTKIIILASFCSSYQLIRKWDDKNDYGIEKRHDRYVKRGYEQSIELRRKCPPQIALQ